MKEIEKLMEFAQLVRDCRSAQKHYFKVRGPDALEASKAPERRVDRAVEEILLLTVPSIFDLPRCGEPVPVRGEGW
jgi:hypothetical protein